jgi:hypothetical protein
MECALLKTMHHITARVRYGSLQYRPLWRSLRRHFPEAIACCLMPNHLHLLVEGDAVERVSTLRAILNNHGGVGQWEPVPPPVTFTDRQKTQRQIRYVFLNPCRAKLCEHPLEWLWSTHRDLVGAVINPWVPPSRVLSALGMKRLPWLHRYVVKDPDVLVRRLDLPLSVRRTAISVHPLADVLLAAALAARDCGRPALRHTSVLLAFDQGWTRCGLLAQTLGITTRQVNRLAKKSGAGRLLAARIVLDDTALMSVRPGCP